MKQQELTLLDLKASEEGHRGFDFICKTYEEKLKFLCQKLQEKCNGKPLSKHEVLLKILLCLVLIEAELLLRFKTFTETMAKGLDFQKGNLMKSVLKHVVNSSRKG